MKNAAKTEKRINPASGRMAQHYLCAGCGEDFPDRQVAIDHIIPVVGPEGFTSWDEYIERMYSDVGNFQVLCRDCHAAKTKLERDARKENKQ